MGQSGKWNETVWYVQGMHCPSCEIVIERLALGISGVKTCEASLASGEVFVRYEGELPPFVTVQPLFREKGYEVSNHPFGSVPGERSKTLLTALAAAAVIVIAFFLFERSGLVTLVGVSATSTYPVFMLFGVLAGVSSCAALVGGMVLSMSKQWASLTGEGSGKLTRIQPHLAFNLGRIGSFALFGLVLGALGQRLSISLSVSSLLVMAVSLLMALLGLQMLGVRPLQRWQFTLPRSMTRFIADESRFRGRYLPFILGAFTVLLPCGFTITAQSLALVSGNPLQGGLILLSFALGTLPSLLFIGLTSNHLVSNPRLSLRFLQVAGLVVLFFAFYNVNFQLNVLGMWSFSDLGFRNQMAIQQTVSDGTEEGMPPLVDGKQVIRMEASAFGYTPNVFRVREGVPVRWEIVDRGFSGCTDAIISRDLFEGSVNLVRGGTAVVEFTPSASGQYKFSCWMGMIAGLVEVVE